MQMRLPFHVVDRRTTEHRPDPWWALVEVVDGERLFVGYAADDEHHDVLGPVDAKR